MTEDKTFYDIRATIADEKGEEWEMGPGMVVLRPLSQNHLNSISSWNFPSYPRRGKVLKFRMYGRNGLDGWDTLAEFGMPNPTPGPYPVWKGQPLPITRTNGDLDVTSYHAQGTSLSPSEVWRLRMRFRKDRDFGPDRVGASPDFPTSKGWLLPVNLTTNFQSSQLTVFCSAGNTISLKLNPKPKDARVRLIGIVDNQGTKIEHPVGSFGDYEFNAQFTIPRESEWIRVTIALAEIRFFEFFAQPTRQ